MRTTRPPRRASKLSILTISNIALAFVLVWTGPLWAAIAHDAATVSTTWTTATPKTFTHTPVGTPAGVICFIAHETSNSDLITGAVTYGGVAMDRIASAINTSAENGRVYAYFLGSAVPTGQQTVSIAHDGSAAVKVATCITMTSATNDSSITSFDTLQNGQTDPQISLQTDAVVTQRYIAMYSSANDISASFTAVSGQTSVSLTDYGVNGARVDRQTTASNGSATLGYTGAATNIAMLMLSIQEGPTTTTPPLGRLFKQDFEGPGDTSWKTDFASGNWSSPAPDLVKQVTNNPHAGTYSIRSNLRNTLVDPITGVTGTTNSGNLTFILKQVETTLNTATPDAAYMKYWFRYDDCAWAGSVAWDGGTGSARVTGKGIYLTDNETSSTSFYTGHAGGDTGEIRIASNYSGVQAITDYLTANWPGGDVVQTLTTGASWGADGTWHSIEFYIQYGAGPSSGHLMTITIDGNLATNATWTNGEIPLPAEWHFDAPQFWYNDQNQISASTDRSGSCNGWQIDDLEIWDRLPAGSIAEVSSGRTPVTRTPVIRTPVTRTPR